MSLGFLVFLVASLSSTYGDFVGQSGDVQVRVSDGIFKCDKIECPPKTHLCEVVKQTTAVGKLTRTITCFSRRKANVLKQEVFQEDADPSQNVSVKVVATRNSIFGYSPVSTSDNRQNDLMGNDQVKKFIPDGLDNLIRLWGKK